MIIRPISERDFDAMLEIHKVCFQAIAYDYVKYEQAYRDFFVPDTTSVATIDGHVVAFTSRVFFEQGPLALPEQKEIIEDYLEANVTRLEKRNRDMGVTENITLEAIPNEFSSSGYCVKGTDADLVSIGVLPAYRGRGIGRVLLQDSLRIAQEHGSTVVFASCWEAGYSPALFLSLGFTPIARITPAYPDGSSALFVGKRLK